MAIKNIIIVLTALFSLHISAAQAPEKKFDKERYDNLNGAFKDDLNDFTIYNVAPGLIDSDIETIKEHKEQKEEELARRKFTLETSWKPLILKMLGGIFGVSAASSVSMGAASIGAVMVGPTNSLKTFAKIVRYPLLITSPVISHLALPITFPAGYIFEKLSELYKDHDISLSQYHLGMGGTRITVGLLFGGIAKYLLNKASSYANEITKLENIIARDEKMITALEKIKESKSEK